MFFSAEDPNLRAALLPCTTVTNQSSYEPFPRSPPSERIFSLFPGPNRPSPSLNAGNHSVARANTGNRLRRKLPNLSAGQNVAGREIFTSSVRVRFPPEPPEAHLDRNAHINDSLRSYRRRIGTNNSPPGPASPALIPISLTGLDFFPLRDSAPLWQLLR